MFYLPAEYALDNGVTVEELFDGMSMRFVVHRSSFLGQLVLTKSITSMKYASRSFDETAFFVRPQHGRKGLSRQSPCLSPAQPNSR